MPIVRPKIVILYLVWSQEPRQYLTAALAGVQAQTYPREDLELLIVYNSHRPGEESALPFIEEQVRTNAANLPHVTILAPETNLGFSGGNNLGMNWAKENGFDYVFLHNADGFLAPGCLENLIQVFVSDSKIGVVQALVHLYPEQELINSAGNSFHFLGFGYCRGYRQPAAGLKLPVISEISYASGAAVCLRTDLLKEHGLWDEDFFMYHEDLEYSFRLRSLGYRIVLASQAVFYHQYQFSKSISKYYWMERNRYGVMLMFFRWPTLFLLLPLAVVLELGLWLFAARGGWLKEKARVYQYWCRPSSWRLWLGKRKRRQNERRMTDKALLATATGVIAFQEAAMKNPLLTHVGNPLMDAYFRLLKKIIRW
ncbi:MAG TPA: glycosyltransferase family 2 protein [Patescibacteria group bacterium]|nr:glycosyltransferase family 2 protein [Patescibacteria group bacterium]